MPSNQPRCRLPTGEPRRIVDPWSMARKEECSAGACPPLGPGSGVAESAGPTRITRPQLRLFRPSCTRSSRHLRFVRKHVPGLRSGMCPPINLDAGSPPAKRAELYTDGRWPEKKNVVRGLVPRWGRGRAWQNPPGQFAVPNLNSRFSYLGVPAPAGMSVSYGNMSRTPIRDNQLKSPLIRNSRRPFVICLLQMPHKSAKLWGAGEGNVARGLVPRQKHNGDQPVHLIFIPWCDGRCRDERFLRT